jgi:2-polyprenyl-6-methoxyphenol hydroxylase-like FAD-dependent oxidoreductase
MSKGYDAIVVGARCAGSPTAMLLARRGYRVLVVDRATFPSDTVSTHVVQPLGVAALKRWGLLDRLVATGCPPIDRYVFDFGPLVVSGTPGIGDAPVAYCPRRIVLDQLLVDAAREAGAELREGFIVDDVVVENGRVCGITGHTRDGATVTERAPIVIGADGRHSQAAAQAPVYHERPTVLASYYSYWSGLPMGGRFEIYSRPGRGFAAMPTHDGATLVIAGWPIAEFETNKRDIEGHFMRAIELAPAFSERLRAGKREAPFAGYPVPNYFRRPYGPGWVLVGDAGYCKDPITAQGINDAFRDAERLAIAIDQALGGGRDFDDALQEYQQDRDRHVLGMFEMTCQLATLEPPPLELQQVFAAMRGNQEAMDRFVQMNAGTISPAEFFAPEYIASIMAAAAAHAQRASLASR